MSDRLAEFITDRVKQIEPVVIPIKLEDYAEKGVLFPNPSISERFFMDSWRKWVDIPVDPYIPHIFTLAFNNIDNIHHGDGFALFLAKVDTQNRPAYTCFEDLNKNTALGLKHLLAESRRRRVVVARQEDQTLPFLLGDTELAGFFRAPFEILAQTDGWVDRTNLAENYNILEQMHQMGLVIQFKYPRRPRSPLVFYRSIAQAA